MIPTIHFGMSREDYDKLTDRVNFSTLKLFGLSPQHYKHALDSGISALDAEGEDDEEQGDTLLQGEATHAAALEPELYGGDSSNPDLRLLDPTGTAPAYVPLPGRYMVWHGKARDKRHKAYQEAEALAKSEGKKLITQKMDRNARAIARAVRGSALSAPYIVGGQREVTLLWDHVEAPVLDFAGWRISMRTRLDYLTQAACLDLKSTKSAKPEDFAKQAWNLGYFSQAAVHLDGLAALGMSRPYFWIAVEHRPPYAVAVYQPSRIGLELGREIYRNHLTRLHVCREAALAGDPNAWPSYADGVMQLDPPRWATPSEMLEAA